MDRTEPSFDMPMPAAHNGQGDRFQRSRYFDPSVHPSQDQDVYAPQAVDHPHHAAHARLYRTGQMHDPRQGYADHYASPADHPFHEAEPDASERPARWILGRVPLIAGLLILGVWAPITFNAMWMQDGPHPAPFFEAGGPAAAGPDEPDGTASAADTQVSTSREAPRTVERSAPAPESLRTAAAPAQQPASPPQPAQAPSGERRDLAEIQSVLQRLGLYDGAIDGLYGPRTRTAIEAFENGHGLAITGQPSPLLREKLGLPGHSSASAAQIAQAPAPAAGIEGLLQSTPPPAAAVDPIAQAIADQSGSQVPASDYAQAYSQLRQPSPALQPAAPPTPQPGVAPPTGVQTISITPPASATALLDVERPRPGDPRVLHVQRLLADLAYAPGSIDGQLGPSTQAAIMRFEADRNMARTGRITDQLLNELTAMTGVAYGG